MIEFEPRDIDRIKKTEALTLVETASHDTTIIIDFDETLFLRNSTAEYLNSLRPKALGLLLLKLLYFIRPWSWLPGSFKDSKIRDWFLVIVSTILLPWTWFLWQNKARQLAKKYENKELLRAIDKNAGSPIVVATLGFNFIVNPILNALPITCDRIVGCRFWQGIRDRSNGKLLMLNKVLSPETIKSAIAITDSIEDLPLLQEVAKPCFVVWDLAKYIPPLNDVYLPLFYVEKVKRVGEKYIYKVILWDDLPVLILAFSWQASNSLLHSASILLLLISFWCVYEIGYCENDLVAEQYEEKPKLSATYYSCKKAIDSWSPWIWSLIFGVLGIACLTKAQEVNLPFNYEFISNQFKVFDRGLLLLACWIVFLIATRLCFWFYNYLNKNTRTWLYIVLQSFRYYGFLAVTPTNLVGTSLLSSQILSRTMLYIIYRYLGGNAENWPQQVPEKLLRLLVFIFILSAIAVGARDLSLWKNWQTWAIMAWCLIQGHRQIFRVTSQFKPIKNFPDTKGRVVNNS
ncbi:haloacid dehalogenase-like hydrolase [Myxosarcina sp. GI1]|uniref:haloacid dehalogenase-like hydrolase n=1 Tax=Myxosarcina sp. GI1 TaxID=1541065 RepID=UPI00068BE8F1|nr:haloacid dehalogenase-like hydrolase [Myxosarcina sp. GI1]